MLDDLLESTRAGLAGLSLPAALQADALSHIELWLTSPAFRAYQPQLYALIEAGRWASLADCFYQMLPFGTGGRRGRVGIGPNRFNPFTLGSSVQGHAAFLRRTRPEGPLSVVIAYDVRCFRDVNEALIPDVPGPLLGLSSRDFANIAAEVYAGAGITVWMPEGGEPMSTPELSHAIRFLGADGGLNVSASHNPSDDNGGKFYNAEGGQEVPPRDEEMAEEVASVRFVDRMPLDRARAAGLIRVQPPEAYEAYIAANLACSRQRERREARVVFTNLHGTGRRTVFEVLKRAGFDVLMEPTQAEYDGAFPTVPFGAPNPEVPESMSIGTRFGESVGADLVMACDPDADRLGVCVRERVSDPSATDPGCWRHLSGNELAVLLTHQVLSTRAHTAAPVVFKTEVTSSLVERVARKHGARVFGHLLVGFKYIGEGLEQLERTGRFAGVPAALSDFAVGVEESHGMLVTAAVRDKDAAGAALVLAELASFEKANGRTLIDTLNDLTRDVGYVQNQLVSLVMQGAAGRAKICAIQDRLRSESPAQLGGRAVLSAEDRQNEAGVFGPLRSGTDRSSRDVLVFQLEGDARVIVRPSGTEPKSKIYVEVAGLDPSATRHACRELSRGVVRDLLSLIDVALPAWALELSDLMPVERKQHFATVVLPSLVERVTDAGTDAAAVDRWLAGALSTYGRDPKQLVRSGVVAWARTAPPELGPRVLGWFAD